jgi:hypothetical protein
LSGERIIPRANAVPGAILPRRLAANRVDRASPDPQTLSLAFVMAPEKASQPVGLQLFHAGGRDAEIEEVFRRILAAGRSLDQVEIACADNGYATFVWEKACRFEWPVTIGPGIPALLTRPGRALLGFCSWIETNFTSGVLRRFLGSGDVTLGNDDVKPGQAARVLVKSGAGWGRATYHICLNRLLSRYRRIESDQDRSHEERTQDAEKATRTQSLLAWITSLLTSVPTPADDGQVSIDETVDAALGFIAACTIKASALDAAAQTALQNGIAELRDLGTIRCSLSVALRFVRDCVNNVSVGRDRSRPGHLHVSILKQSGFSNRPLLFIIGLEEGRVFPAPIEDPVLLDAERKLISPLCVVQAIGSTRQFIRCLLGWQAPALCLSLVCEMSGRVHT